MTTTDPQHRDEMQAEGARGLRKTTTDPTEETTVSHPPLTAEEFGGVPYAGVPIVDFEDWEAWGAYGHVDPAAMCAALDAWTEANVGPGEDPWEDDLVAHRWAVVTERGPEWVIRWGGVSADTPGAFPITLAVV